MKIAVLIARILLGLIFVVFGLNPFLKYLPMDENADGPDLSDQSDCGSTDSTETNH